ncbi:MAG: mannose-6-phosphate isomerase, class [Actinomycetota bacterium]|nr:mannose-6-phosphate isomerase, class [Actinomycetota bacterium]
MRNPIRGYEWGSVTALACLQGRTPDGSPEAELWMGAHPSAPSALLPPGGPELPLDVLIKQSPELLGDDVLQRFGARLPYLLKVLAIAKPLSVQVHPGARRALAAWENESDAGRQHYVDPFPKPELLYALEPMDVMCGFRPAKQASHLLEALGGARLASVREALDGPGEETDRLQCAFRTLVTWPDEDRNALTTEVRDKARLLLREVGRRPGDNEIDGDDRRALTWALRLARLHPHDPLVVAPFLLDLVRLDPGQTLFVPEGAPHAYLHGCGVEIMGNSDNVLRAGLTHKPVAVDELLEVIDGRTRPVRDVPQTRVGPHEIVWHPPAEEFQLSRIWLTDADPVEVWSRLRGPQILLCTRGCAVVRHGDGEVRLRAGESAFVAAGGGRTTVAGPAEVFRAAPGTADQGVGSETFTA